MSPDHYTVLDAARLKSLMMPASLLQGMVLFHLSFIHFHRLTHTVRIPEGVHSLQLNNRIQNCLASHRGRAYEEVPPEIGTRIVHHNRGGQGSFSPPTQIQEMTGK